MLKDQEDRAANRSKLEEIFFICSEGKRALYLRVSKKKRLKH
eukprot:UN23791